VEVEGFGRIEAALRSAESLAEALLAPMASS
jgi:hypothetical protein